MKPTLTGNDLRHLSPRDIRALTGAGGLVADGTEGDGEAAEESFLAARNAQIDWTMQQVRWSIITDRAKGTT